MKDGANVLMLLIC